LIQLKQAEATEEKERGNTLFGRKKYEEAIKSFSRCIELDPRWVSASNSKGGEP
jgi:hypothetical protein